MNEHQLADLAPHGDFTIHANDITRGPSGAIAVYVICACGRGYSWEGKIPAAELIAWLSSHGPDISSDEENRRVKAARHECWCGCQGNPEDHDLAGRGRR